MWQFVYVSQSPLFWSHTLVRMCTCFSICTNVHLTPHYYFTIITQLHGNVYTSWVMCVCPSYPLWDAHLGLMCTCISTCMHLHLTPISAPLPLHRYIETLVPLCGTVCVQVILLLVPHVKLHVWLTPLHNYTETWCPYLVLYECPRHLSSGPRSLVRMYIHQYMYACALPHHFCFIPLHS